MRALRVHVHGQTSNAWCRWWDHAINNPGTPTLVYEALPVALLSLGAPPAYELMTQDLINIVCDELARMYPHRHVNSREGRAQRRKYDMVMTKLTDRYTKQLGYNKRLNAFAQEYGLVYFHRNHDPAQFRKLFAAYMHVTRKEARRGKDKTGSR